jgi:hypothetical protein
MARLKVGLTLLSAGIADFAAMILLARTHYRRCESSRSRCRSADFGAPVLPICTTFPVL